MNSLLRNLVILGVAVLLALVLGYMLSTPDSFTSLGFVALLVGSLALPLFLKWHWHYPLLLFSWNATIIMFFLPGSPALWMGMAACSLFFCVLGYTLQRKVGFQNVSALTWSVLAFAAVVFVTAKFRSGLGLRSLGGGGGFIGGKNYFVVFVAAAGYFALSSRRIPAEKVGRYVLLYFLGTMTAVMSNLIYTAGKVGGEAIYWLYLIFPVDLAMTQIGADYQTTDVLRLTGFTFGSIGCFNWLLFKYGIRDLMDWRHLWRPLLMGGIIILSLLGGFRSVLVFFVLMLALQFTLEKLWRTRYMVMAVVLLGLFLGGSALFSTHLPTSLQRVISFLPVEVDPLVRMDAEHSTNWRLSIWRIIIPEIPEYLWLGKGYAMTENDYYLADLSQRYGFTDQYDLAVMTGSYHSGPLSLLVIFGLPGTVAFVVFCGFSLRRLYLYYRDGEERLRKINTVLFSLFATRVIIFIAVYGSTPQDFQYLVGLIGFGVALNGAKLPRPAAASVPALPARLPEPTPAVSG